MKEFPSGNRCVICDWSPTNDQSLFNPQVEEYGHNRLTVCPHTGDMLCDRCVGISVNLNRVFKIYTEEENTKDRRVFSEKDLRKVRRGQEGNYIRIPVRYDE